MSTSRSQFEDFEDQFLATYGVRSKDSKGRKFPEEQAEYRA